MHEMSLVEKVVEVVLAEAQRYGARQVTKVKLKVGRLLQVIPETLAFCYEIAVQGTLAEGSQLYLEEVPIEVRCRQCGETFEVENFVFLCPRCAVADVETLAGMELIVETIELALGGEENGNQNCAQCAAGQR